MNSAKKYIPGFSLYITAILFHGCQKPAADQQTVSGTIKISFRNTVNGTPLALNTGVYSNPSGEIYTVSKLRYYVSNISLSGTSNFNEPESYHLVDQSNVSSLSFSFPSNLHIYTSLKFLLGVDSLRNVSGAQTGALDPTNDMFWTWNSGYVMAKMEGNSPVSTQVNNKIEYHIGGFSGASSVLKTIAFNISISPLDIRDGKTSEIMIDTDLNQWWVTPNTISFATIPVCTTPGTLARQIADNYSKMFSLTSVINY